MQDFSNYFSSLGLDQLACVTGGDGNPGQCFDSVWPWAVGGAVAGAPGGWGTAALGAAAGGGAAYLTSPACGDGTSSPATIARNGVTSALSSAGGEIKHLAGKIPHPW